MSGKALVDNGLLREAETLFANTDEILIAAFHVLKVKQQGESTGTQLLKALGAKTFLAKEAPQPRLLCFTVRRSKQARGFKLTLHTCKPPGERDATPLVAAATTARGNATASAAAAAAATKSYPLKSITEVVVPANKYEHNPSHLLELRFSGSGSYSTRGEVINQFKLRTADELQLVLSLIINLLRQNNYRLPRFTGADVGEVHTWWLGHQSAVLPALGPFAAEVLLPGGDGEGGEGSSAGGAGGSGAGGGGGPRVLLSAKEERDLEELLDMFAMGVGDVAEFEGRLREEHEALEAANVHSIMVTAPAAEAVVGQIRKTQSLLEDLDEYLQVFDTKLRHMREDIAAIEASNNTLELQSRNNNKLMASLQSLLSDLRLPREVEALLEGPPFGKDSRLPAITRAAWQLHAKLQRLDPAAPGCLSYYLLQMRVAQEARESLGSLSARFVAQALTHLRGAVSGAVEEVLGTLAANTSDKAARLLPPSHDRLRSSCFRHAGLVRVMAALDPPALPRLQAAYCQHVNMLLRKELRVSVAELRRAASLDMQANPIDYNLTSSFGRTAAGGAAGSVVGSRGPAGSVLSGSEENEREDVGSVAASSDHLGLGGLGVGLGFGAGPLSSGSRQSRSTFRSILSRGGGGAFDPGPNMAIPLHEAWEGLLEGYLPHLLAEAEGAAGHLLLRRGEVEAAAAGEASAPDVVRDESGGRKKGRRKGAAAAAAAASASGTGGQEAAWGGEGGSGPQRPLSRQGRQVEESLLAGVDAEFMALVDLTSKSHQVLCLPMMAMATQCINALATRGSVAAPLRVVLAACHARLRSHFTKFVAQQQAAVEGYTARLVASGSVKSQHVVNFVAQFALMAHHMEVMLSQSINGLLKQLSGGAAGAPLDSTPLSSSLGNGHGGGGGGGGASKRAAAGANDDAEGDDGDEDDLEETSRRRELLQSAAAWQVRPEVDAVYGSFVGLMFGGLERIAAADAKHGDRLRAENYAYFVEAVRPLVRHVAALEPYLLQAEAKQEESVARYVRYQLQYTNLWRLLEASERVDQLLEVVTPGEVAYQAGFAAADVRGLVATSMKDVDKKVQKMYGRVRKHLGNSNLAFRVWERIYEQLVRRYQRLAEQLALCYPSLELSPSVEELEDVFRSVGPSATSP